MPRVLAACSLAAALVGCSSTNVVSGNAALRHGGYRDAFTADDVRIAPSSKLRFCREPIGCSDWIYASDLRVDDTGAWIDRTAGYKWAEVDYVEVKGLDGIKTTGAIVGITAAAAIIIPIAVAAACLKSLPNNGGGDGPSGRVLRSAGDGASQTLAVVGAVAEAAAVSATTSEPAAETTGHSWYWGATLRGGGATSDHASRLFTTGARVRSVITLGAHVDSSVAYAKDLMTGGAIARLRLGSFLELGAGARLAHTKGMDGAWNTGRMYAVQLGFHSPVSARFALPLGIDVAWGHGPLEREIRIPFGLRYTSPSGHWTGTLQPATPSYARRADADKGRWSVAVGLELGVTL